MERLKVSTLETAGVFNARHQDFRFHETSVWILDKNEAPTYRFSWVILCP